MSTQPGPVAPPAAWIRRLTIAFCLVAIVLAAVQTWTVRFEMNPDGVQYLDNADAYRSGDLAHAVNSQWSPLYPWLIGALFTAARPTPLQECPLVHLLNFLLFAMSLAGFLFFTTAVRALIPPAQRASLTGGLLLLAYSAFLYCSLDLTNLRYVVPDLLVNLFAFLAAGLLVRMASGTAAARHYAALGVTLGLGYLAKTPFLLYGLLCLAMAGVLARKQAFTLRRIGLAAALFIAITAPYIWMLSSAKGRFTFGDSGKFNVIWMVNGVPYHNWQGGPGDNGRPIHPTRQLSANPAIFEFATPVAGAYPPWYDPIYWNEGARIAWRPADFANALVRQLRLYGYLVHHRQTPLVFALLLMCVLTPSKRRILGRFQPLWPVLALGIAPFAMYAPIHAEGRYLAPFFVLLWTALFFSFLPGIENSRVALAIAAVAALLMLVEAVTVAITSAPIGSAHDAAENAPQRLHYDIARNLEALGLKRGDPVAIVSGDFPYYWARLSGARITMEISLTAQSQWPEAREIVARHGAAFVIAPSSAGVVNQPGWRPLGNTGTFAYPLASLK
ncbi:MAG: hypothetical protein LAP38_27210 [Acidobacteriia bacterium]|nr:hypothetical protein [Terriglobia bacterium]